MTQISSDSPYNGAKAKSESTWLLTTHKCGINATNTIGHFRVISFEHLSKTGCGCGLYLQVESTPFNLENTYMQWFRFYSEAVNDPKVQSLSGDLFKAWVNILCLAAQQDGRLITTDLPFQLRSDSVTVEHVTSALIDAGLLVSKGKYLHPHNWDKRQFKSDTSRERTKRYRDRQRDVTVTPPEQNRTEQKQIAPIGFDNFWAAYPRKIGKLKAKASYIKALRLTTEETIMKALVSWLPSVKGTEEKYIPHPTTWLNQGRWDDEAPVEDNDQVYRGVLV